MATNVPPGLKPAGITTFMVRAIQLESAKPVITYWCYYWVVQRILEKQLHNVDGDCLQFTTTIMDKLERMKVDHAGNDAILDDIAGQAYVEQFAQETFDRALRPLKANKVTQQTASTFEAAATFFQLVNIWGQVDPETQGKIKYAKWNAARILKAIKEGKDPNESNPKQEESSVGEDVAPLDPNDPEVQLISSTQPRPATVEDVPDDGRSPHVQVSGYSLNTAAPVSAPNSPFPPTASIPDPVSPIAPPDVPSQEPGSYFPNASAATDESPLDLPSTTSMPPPGSVHHAAPGLPPGVVNPNPHHAPMPPSVPYTTPGGPSSPQGFYHSSPQQQTAPTPPFIPTQQHRAPSQAPSAPPIHHYSQPVASAQHYGGSSGQTGGYTCDDMAMAEAQKHAKWAISALNFEDVPTAVRELQAALATLGAR
ncbi:putative short-chain dehydrogenase reductase sdr [Rosellinia necatrix]|uniref:Putative short-chain dehydrogenase reductase sdr n=1 Tax=Rosellinia necatrix TaxID=77044 RepID=A0A1W2TBF8_ROSNE|nr:putative short-chain dehydrogenase reductase sdr [Rosellinia necatrix]